MSHTGRRLILRDSPSARDRYAVGLGGARMRMAVSPAARPPGHAQRPLRLCGKDALCALVALWLNPDMTLRELNRATLARQMLLAREKRPV